MGIIKYSGNIGLLALLSCLLAGCGGDVRQEYQQIPLLISKKAVDLKPDKPEAALAIQEPPLPALPATALVSTPPDFGKYVKLVNRSRQESSSEQGGKAPAGGQPSAQPTLPPVNRSPGLQLPEPVPASQLPPRGN